MKTKEFGYHHYFCSTISKHALTRVGLIKPITRYLATSLLLALAAGAWAESVRVFGPPAPGTARPPLWLNLGPFSTTSSAPPYTPAQVRHAYGFDQLPATGSGQKIGIVDAYGSSSIQKDLNQFCSQFGISSTTVQIIYAQGVVPPPNRGWAQETSLDVEWAHAIAPGASILLVVAKSNSLTDLLQAVDVAVANGATTVSMSWGASEFSSETSYDSHFTTLGVTFVASSGDNGESTSVEWPATSPNVVSVGGTSLSLTSSGDYSSETAWSKSGGGISVYETPQPVWQTGWFQASWTPLNRGVPDVSYLADPNTGVYVVYKGLWYVFGGTSVGAPQWAALVALSNSLRSSGSLSSANSAIYSVAASGSTTTPNSINSSYLIDITLGNNGSDPDDYAILGYDLVTGLGSPKANNLAPALSSK